MHFRSWNRLLPLLPLLLVAGASAATLACPPTLRVTEAAAAPAGFVLFADGNPPVRGARTPTPVPLRTIMFSEGPPEAQAWLAPDSTHGKDQEWHFAANGDRDVWVTCGYGASFLVLSKPAGAAVQSCRLTRSDTRPPALMCR